MLRYPDSLGPWRTRAVERVTHLIKLFPLSPIYGLHLIEKMRLKLHSSSCISVKISPAVDVTLMNRLQGCDRYILHRPFAET